jgi:hypothetical protein
MFFNLPKKYPIEVIMNTGSTMFMIEGMISAILGQTIYNERLLILPDMNLIL